MSKRVRLFSSVLEKILARLVFYKHTGWFDLECRGRSARSLDDRLLYFLLEIISSIRQISLTV
jgi:hypothetical protein